MLTILVLLACKGGGDGDPNDTNDTEPVDTGDPLPADVCERWDLIRSQWAMPVFTGNLDECDAGTPTAEELDTFKKGLNLYRWIAGVEPVSLDLEYSEKSQECALMMAANNDLDDSPPSSWECYTADGAEAADHSQLVNSGGVLAIDSSIGGDPTDADDPLSGRRWLLSPTLAKVGAGFTDRYTCIWLDADAESDKEWVAWPPPGQITHEAMTYLDFGGWSWQSDDIEILLTPQVHVTLDGTDMPVRVYVLDENYGSKSAIKWIPVGWKAERDKTYHVSIANLGDPIEYDVEVLSCR